MRTLGPYGGVRNETSEGTLDRLPVNQATGGNQRTTSSAGSWPCSRGGAKAVFHEIIRQEPQVLVQEVAGRKARWNDRRPSVWAARVIAALASAGVVFILLLRFVFPYFSAWLEKHAGRGAAEKDWREERAVVFVYSPVATMYRRGKYFFEPNYDSRTGLKMYYPPPWQSTAFCAAYNNRVQELIHTHGLPPWSVRDYLLSRDELIALLQTDTLEQVTQFPQTLGDGLVLRNGGSFSRWGYTCWDPEDALIVEARFGGSITIPDPHLPVYVCRLGEHSGMVVVRSGQSWLAVFHEDGRHFITVFRAPDTMGLPSSTQNEP